MEGWPRVTPELIYFIFGRLGLKLHRKSWDRELEILLIFGRKVIHQEMKQKLKEILLLLSDIEVVEVIKIESANTGFNLTWRMSY